MSIACSNHVAFGYVDQPPLSIVLLWLNRLLLGDSLLALRMLPALAGAVVVVLTGLMARELGGNRFAQFLAALAVLLAPQFLGTNHYFSMNAFDLLFWVLTAYLLILLIKRQQERLWLILGVVLGLGLLNKISVLWLGFGIFLGFLLTQPKIFLKRGPWLAGVIAFLLFLPYVVWQIPVGWPTLEFMKNATAQKYVEVAPLEFLMNQIDPLAPTIFLICVIGLLFLLFARNGKPFRVLGIAYLTVVLILIVNRHSKAEYLMPAYPMLIAAGSVVISRFQAQRRWLWAVKVVFVILMLADAAIRLPFAIPVLPVETFIRYEKWLGVVPSTSEKKELSELPQGYADMFGWENMAATVARVYERLSPNEQAQTVIFTDNYGEAAALEFFGAAYHLPSVLSGHNNYWLWGYGDYTGQIAIVVTGYAEYWREAWDTMELAETIRAPYVMPYENNLPVYLCKGLKMPVEVFWQKVKHYE